MKCGDSFHGRILERRLDGRKKRFRQVFRCKGEKEVIIIYKRASIPAKMALGPNQLPLEYLCYLKYHKELVTGLPKLVDHGYDDKYVWMITEYITLTNLFDYMDDGDYLDEDNFPLFESYVSFMRTFFMVNSLLCQSAQPLCITPDNIYFHVDEEGLACYLTGLDTMLIRSYEKTCPEHYYDTRYQAPETVSGKYDIRSISYSFALCILSVIKRDFPLPVPDNHYMVPVEETVTLVREASDKLSELGLPEQLHKLFSAFINPNPGRRAMLLDDDEYLAKFLAEGTNDDESDDNNNINQCKRTIMDPFGNNTFEGCFIKTKGRGLYDVGGMKELKEKVMGLLSLNLHPEYAKRQQIETPNIMLVGPTGTGKSFFAKKLAEQIDRPYYLAHTSDLSGSYHGESAQKIRDLFQQAEMNSPCVLILDEFDSVAQKRNVALSPGAAESTAELLSQIAECKPKGIIVIATTNSVENVDIAIMRAGRFDKKIYVGFPDDKEKEAILRCVLRDLPTTIEANDYPSLVRLMNRFVAADIAEVVETVKADMTVPYANDVFSRFYETSIINDDEKAAFQKFVNDENEHFSEYAFNLWCKAGQREDLLNDYVKYSARYDKVAKPQDITYAMLEKAIKEHKPSNNKESVRDNANKYQEFLSERERMQSKIGFYSEGFSGSSNG